MVLPAAPVPETDQHATNKTPKTHPLIQRLLLTYTNTHTHTIPCPRGHMLNEHTVERAYKTHTRMPKRPAKGLTGEKTTTNTKQYTRTQVFLGRHKNVWNARLLTQDGNVSNHIDGRDVASNDTHSVHCCHVPAPQHHAIPQ